MARIDMAKKVVRLGLHTVTSPTDSKEIVKKALKKRTANRERHTQYIRWFDDTQVLDEAALVAQREAATALKQQPLISILVPLYDTPDHFLRECIESVRAQTYTNWELCLADDASPSPHVVKTCKEYAAKYPNIKFTSMKKNQHIVGASNEALKLASGDFIALLDHDDLLLPQALFEMVQAINNKPQADLIYSDEDKVDEAGVHVEPFFKPDWSPDFLRSCNYITHFAVLRKSIMDEIGGFRFGTEGAQDWDLFLRFTAKTDRVHHVPKILYSWRKSPTSTAKVAKSKPYAYINQKRVLRDSLATKDVAASVFESIYLGFWRVRYNILGNPLVSIVIPTKDNYKFISTCINSIIEQTSYANFEIIIVDTGSTDEQVLDFYETKVVRSNKIKIVNWKAKQFNFSAACNTGAEHAAGDYLLFLNNDTEIMTSDWIESMLEHAQRPEIGMVGCKLLFPNDNIQHAGVVLRASDIAVHPFYNMHPKQDIFTNIYIANIRNCLAVTAACSMVAAFKFKAVGGFNENLRVTYNDVDLCLRLVDAGHNNLYTPYAEVRHYESISVGKVSTSARNTEELHAASEYMRKKWGKYLERDPFYNDNFSPTGQPYYLFER